MKKIIRFALAIVVGAVLVSPVNAAEKFAFSFEWGDIPLCTSGYPNRVPNPRFTLSGVPEGVTSITFSMIDLQSPYNHGGGKVKYNGESVIEPGAFNYDSPCPPGGQHTYVWTAIAKGKGVRVKAKAKRKYPEKK